MPVSPATVRQALVPDGPAAHDVPSAQVGDGGEGEHPRNARTRGAVLVGACVAAFLLGFAAVTFVMRDADSVTKRTKTPPTSAASSPAEVVAPAPSSPRATVAPPPSALVADQGGAGQQASPQQPGPSPTARTENGGPAPSTSAPAPTTTSPPTTTPPTTTP